MSPEQYAVLLYRVDRLETEHHVRHTDHETRIRDLEATVTKVVAKVTVWAAVGSVVGASLVTAFVNLVVR
jgi:hypothetical protein